MKVKKLKNYDDWGMPSRTGIGVAISVIYGGLLISLAIWRWSDIAKLDLNELGDFAAGAFGPMAILWLVLGYFQQGDELKQNTSTLKEQAVELAKSVHQQEQLVAITREQLEEAKREARLEAARLEAAARPKFESYVQLFSHYDNGTDVDISLKNVGAPCSHLRAISVSTGVNATLHPARGTQTYIVRVRRPSPGPLEEAEFLVSYLDAAGRPGSQTFSVRQYADENERRYLVSGDDDGRVWQHATASAAEMQGV